MGMITRGRSGAVLALLTVAAALGVAACGGSSSTNNSTAPTTFAYKLQRRLAAEQRGAAGFGRPPATYPSCLEKHGVLPLNAGGSFDTLASRIDNPKYTTVLKDCGADFAHGAASGHPLSTTTVKILHAYIACVAKNGYKLPTPNTSGKGPVFPAGTDRIRKYRAAATNCVSIYQAEFRSMYGTA